MKKTDKQKLIEEQKVLMSQAHNLEGDCNLRRKGLKIQMTAMRDISIKRGEEFAKALRIQIRLIDKQLLYME